MVTTALDKWPAYARLSAVAQAGHLPQLLHHYRGHELGIPASIDGNLNDAPLL
jgi:hypothetical protein